MIESGSEYCQANAKGSTSSPGMEVILPEPRPDPTLNLVWLLKSCWHRACSAIDPVATALDSVLDGI